MAKSNKVKRGAVTMLAHGCQYPDLGLVAHAELSGGPWNLLMDLREVLSDKAPKLSHEVEEEIEEMLWNDLLAGGDMTREDFLEEAMHRVVDALDEISPPGAYFGTREGLETHYGWWAHPEEHGAMMDLADEAIGLLEDMGIHGVETLREVFDALTRDAQGFDDPEDVGVYEDA